MAKVPIMYMINGWASDKKAQGVTDDGEYTINRQCKVFSDFFEHAKVKTVDDLKYGVASQFLEWRSSKSYNPLKKARISASILRHELQVLKQMARFAYDNDWIKKGDLWSRVKVKNIVGVNCKTVLPLSVGEQKAVLEAVSKLSAGLCDSVLFLLLSGIRVGELDSLAPDSLKEGIIEIKGTKTASADRIIPACPALTEIFRRGEIFKLNSQCVKRNLSRGVFHRTFPTVHPHRFRHSFAVNKLLAEVPLQMVSYQLGHKSISLTADLYGKYIPEHFKIGFQNAA